MHLPIIPSLFLKVPNARGYPRSRHEE
jgi:hypothetical protein